MGEPAAVEDERVARMARITLRPIGSSLPLGFLALGGASVALSAMQLSWSPISESHQVAVAAMVFAVPLQVIAAVFGFLARDSVGGTGNAVLAGSWLATGTVTLLSAPGSHSRVLGVLLLFVCAALFVPVAAAALGKVVAAVVILAAAGRFALTGVYELVGSPGWEHVSGWWGVGVAVVALYAALAFEIEDVRRRTVLPVLRHGVGRSAVTGGVETELARVEREAGVREQL
jgi:succinate-acetate transporter protein